MFNKSLLLSRSFATGANSKLIKRKESTFFVYLSTCLFSEITEQKTSNLFKVAGGCVDKHLREFNFGSNGYCLASGG
jgi:hypothetical protein